MRKTTLLVLLIAGCSSSDLFGELQPTGGGAGGDDSVFDAPFGFGGDRFDGIGAGGDEQLSVASSAGSGPFTGSGSSSGSGASSGSVASSGSGPASGSVASSGSGPSSGSSVAASGSGPSSSGSGPSSGPSSSGSGASSGAAGGDSSSGGGSGAGGATSTGSGGGAVVTTCLTLNEKLTCGAYGLGDSLLHAEPAVSGTYHLGGDLVDLTVNGPWVAFTSTAPVGAAILVTKTRSRVCLFEPPTGHASGLIAPTDDDWKKKGKKPDDDDGWGDDDALIRRVSLCE